jgi:hypothetical protein
MSPHPPRLSPRRTAPASRHERKEEARVLFSKGSCLESATASIVKSSPLIRTASQVSDPWLETDGPYLQDDHHAVHSKGATACDAISLMLQLLQSSTFEQRQTSQSSEDRNPKKVSYLPTSTDYWQPKSYEQCFSAGTRQNYFEVSLR